jgi:hypothetical protein
VGPTIVNVGSIGPTQSNGTHILLGGIHIIFEGCDLHVFRDPWGSTVKVGPSHPHIYSLVGRCFA